MSNNVNKSSDNVILLGAGFSADAGIPLLNGFMETMWNLARTGRCNGQTIPPDKLKVLLDALKVRDELDGYHGRVAFDVWNIEDILSILSFTSKDRLDDMTRAIAEVIELTCNVKYKGMVNNSTEDIGIYDQFWRALIRWADSRKLPIPPILTFNYDLVLERSLLNSLVGTYYRKLEEFEYGGIEIDYAGAASGNVPLKCQTATWKGEQGMTLREFLPKTPLGGINFLKFEIIKLHGSVNFPRLPRPDSMGVQQLIAPAEDPLILPPIFNKATDAIGKKVWDRALEVLRSCKRLIICGYSLPATDIYMQYFLKAALGPNQDLDRIHVFDPVICDDNRPADGEALRERYARNFSQPIQRRINFVNPQGTTRFLTSLLREHPENLLFA